MTVYILSLSTFAYACFVLDSLSVSFLKTDKPDELIIAFRGATSKQSTYVLDHLGYASLHAVYNYLVYKKENETIDFNKNKELKTLMLSRLALFEREQSRKFKEEGFTDCETQFLKQTKEYQDLLNSTEPVKRNDFVKAHILLRGFSEECVVTQEYQMKNDLQQAWQKPKSIYQLKNREGMSLFNTNPSYILGKDNILVLNQLRGGCGSTTSELSFVVNSNIGGNATGVSPVKRQD